MESKSVDAGFDADALDPAIAAARDRLTKVIADVERIRAGIEPYLDELRRRMVEQLATGVADDVLSQRIGRTIDWMEKYARVATSFTKVVDEATRLRSFVAGGSDSRPDLSSMSDTELSKVFAGYASRAKAAG